MPAAILKFVNQLESAGFHNCFGQKRPKTHHLMFTLDWIFIRGPIRCEAAQVETSVRASDHYPLTAVLRVD